MTVLHDAVRRIGDTGPDGVLFWTGAGISTAAPTSLPTGWELTDRIFGQCFESDALPRILGYHALLGRMSADICDRWRRLSTRPPRLETVLGVAVRQLGDGAFGLLDDVRGAVPNWYHRFFAAHVAAGGRHVTANFDMAIETATGGGADDRIHHFHRAFDGATTPDELGATLAAVEKGFDPRIAARLRSDIDAAQVVVVIGYSGSDFFDVDQALAVVPDGTWAGRTVYWVAHSDCRWHEPEPAKAALPTMAKELDRTGITVRYLCGPTTELLTALADRWSLKPGPVEDGPRRVASIGLGLTATQRRAATFALYRELNIPAEVDRMLREGDLGGVSDDERWLAESESLWEQGRWNTLRRKWRRGRLPAGVSRARRDERIGASLWAQGRLLPAYLWLSRCLRRTSDPDDRWMFAETLGRVVDHMLITPELRVIGHARRRYVNGLLSGVGQRAGVHAYILSRDLTDRLGPVARPSRAVDSQLWFEQTGGIMAALAYHHRGLRDGAKAMTVRGLRSRYREHVHLAAAAGSLAAAWRVLLLPRVGRVFQLNEVVAAAMALQYGQWQRLRMVGGYLLSRLRLR